MMNKRKELISSAARFNYVQYRALSRIDHELFIVIIRLILKRTRICASQGFCVVLKGFH